MSTESIPAVTVRDWQQQLTELVTTPEQLLEQLQLPEELLEAAKAVSAHFPLRVPQAYVNKIRPRSLHDPLLRQILPIGAEFTEAEGFSLDPLEESESNPVTGVIHKYHGRVLFVAASQCAIHCRYCFRRHFNYHDNSPSRAQWEQALTYVQQHKEIDEVILSGGDPLSVSDKQVGWLLDQIESIDHVARIRIHSRLPVVLPDRITRSELIPRLKSCPKQTVMVVHCNHSQELGRDVCEALQSISQAGITLLNQTVLLKGVNDNTDCLSELSKQLFKNGALPYYLHLLDKVSGTAHFEVAEQSATAIYTELQARLPGYLVPRLVREEPGARNKTLICHS